MGNKTDLATQRKVSTADGQKLAQQVLIMCVYARERESERERERERELKKLAQQLLIMCVCMYL